MDAVVLIPGFFGFGQFGTAPDTIEYFAGVRDALVAREPELRGRIVVHEPPPTGSIDERVASLHDTVEAILTGREFPNDAQALPDNRLLLRHGQSLKADRIHLVGHSAGGVDARLYANSSFFWTGAPRGEERKAALAALGHVVTLSSPHFGTPIATNAVFDRDALLFGTYVLSLIGMRRVAEGTHLLENLVSPLFRFVPGGGRRAAATDIVKVVGGLDGPAAKEVEKFFSKLENDRQLLDDLTVLSLEERTRHLRSTDHANVHCYVSVAPPPGNPVLELLPRRRLYAISYEATSKGLARGIPPQGPNLGGLGGDVAARLDDPHPSDCVVPAMSQTLDGQAAGIVVGDHLDVVGHFDGGPGITVFKSGSDFDQERFNALWSDIARVITSSP